MWIVDMYYQLIYILEKKIVIIIQNDLASNVVHHLVDQLPNDVKQGRTITFDRYFMDIKLSEALRDRKMTYIGVVDYRRIFLPNELKACRKKTIFIMVLFFKFTNACVMSSKRKKANSTSIFTAQMC